MASIPTFVAKGTFDSGTGAIAPGIPAGLVNDDLMLLVVESANQAITAPTGWTEIGSQATQSTGTAAAAGGVRLGVFWKIYGGLEAAPSVADTGDHTTGIIIGIRGADPSNPFHLTSGSAAAANTSMTWPTFSTTVDNIMVVLATAVDTDAASTTNVGAVTAASLASIVEQHDQSVISGAGGGVHIATATKAAAGALGTITATASTSVTHAYLTLAIQGAEPVARTVGQFKNDQLTVIPVGGATSGDGVSNEIFLKAEYSSGNRTIATTPKYEKDTVATGFSGTADASMANLVQADVTNPQRAVRGAVMIYDDVNKRMVTFGGYDGTTRYNEVWARMVDKPGQPWRKLAPTGTPPGGRNLHGATFLKANLTSGGATRAYMLVWGGFTTADQNDMWLLRLDTIGSEAWTQVTQTSAPTAREYMNGHIVATPGPNSHSAYVYLFGGWATNREDQLVRCTIDVDAATTTTWTTLKATGAVGNPGIRTGAILAYKASTSKLYLYGGYNGTSMLNDFWEYDIAGNTWTNTTPTGTAPTASETAAGGYDPVNNRFWFTGGWTTNGTFTTGINQIGYISNVGATEAYNIVRTSVANTGNQAYTGNAFAAYAIDTTHNWLAIKQQADCDPTTDMERYGYIIDFAETASSNFPVYGENEGEFLTARDAPASLYDPVAGEWLMIGGFDDMYNDTTIANGTHSNDVWAYNATTNTWRYANAGWKGLPPCEGRSAVYDTTRNRIILFGGLTGIGMNNNEVWSLTRDTNGDYVAAAMFPTGTKPGIRWLHSAVYDAANDRMIIAMGGNSSGPISDVWALGFSGGADGAWTTLSPTGSPTAVVGMGFADKPSAKRLYQVGGATVANLSTVSSQVCYLDYSTTNGAWTVVSTTGGTGRRTPACAYDAGMDRLVVFGGYNGSASIATLNYLNLATTVWEVPTTTLTPDARRSTIGAFINGAFYMTHGRSDSSMWYRNTWRLQPDYITINNSVWTNLFPDAFTPMYYNVTGLTTSTGYHWQAWVTENSVDSAKVSYPSNISTASTYYFDGSDATTTDPQSVWTSDANAIDGSTGSSATTSTAGSTSSNYIMAEGTNAPLEGGVISQVRVRMWGEGTGSVTNPSGNVDVYTNSLGANLGTLTRSYNSNPAANGGDWSPYATLSVPSGGWDWTKVGALEFKSYMSGGNGTPSIKLYRIEIEVTSSYTNTETDDDFYVGSPSVSAPTVTGSAATNLDLGVATANGNVTADGTGAITERGFVLALSASADPTTGTNIGKIIVSGSTGGFNAQFTGLDANVGYKYRAYAINSAGTSYSSAQTFTSADYKTFQLYAVMQNTGGGTTYLTLYNRTDGTIVAGSEISTTSASPVLVQKQLAYNATNFVDAKEYEYRMKVTSGSTGNVYSAGMHIRLHNLTKATSYNRISRFGFQALSGAAAATTQRFLYTAANYSSPSTDFIITGTEDTNGTNNFQLYNVTTTDSGTTGSGVGSGIDVNSTSKVWSANTGVTMVDTNRYLGIFNFTSGGARYHQGILAITASGAANTVETATNVELLDTARSSQLGVNYEPDASKTPFTPSAFDGATYYFETISTNSHASNAYGVTLVAYNAAGTATDVVTQNSAANTGSSNVRNRTTSITIPTDTVEVRVRIAGTAAAKNVVLGGARIVAVQTNATKTLIHVPMGGSNNESNDDAIWPIVSTTQTAYNTLATNVDQFTIWKRDDTKFADYYEVTSVASYTKTHTTDANKRAALTHAHTTDSNRKKSFSISHTTSSYLRKQFTKTHTTDSFLRKQFTKTHTTDANKKVSGTARTHTTDANKKKSGLTRTHTTDALKRQQFTKTHTTDANKKVSGNLHTHTTDANKKKATTRTHTTDANKKLSGNTRSHTTDAAKFGTIKTLKDNFDSYSGSAATYGTIWTYTGGNYNYVNMTGGQAVFSSQTFSQYSTITTNTAYKIQGSDVFVQLANAGNQSIVSHESIFYVDQDTNGAEDYNNKVYITLANNVITPRQVVAGSNTQVAGTSGLTYNSASHKWWRIREASGTTYIDFSPDGINWTNQWNFANVITMTYVHVAVQEGTWQAEGSTTTSTFDNLNVVPITKTHTTDAYLRTGVQTFTRTHTTDALKRKQFTLSHTTDANKKKTTTLTHTTDAKLRKQFTKTHTTDAFLRKQFTKTHTTDANKRLATLKSHTTDANKKVSGNTRSHTTDANKKKAGLTLSHTTSANKRVSGNLHTHTTDANKKVSGTTRSHTTDALKRQQFTKTHTTDSFLRKQFTKTHTTDANKKKTTTVQHTTDANKKKSGFTLTHTTSANKRVAGITKFHTTDSNRKVSGNLHTHTTDANKKKSGLTLTHTTDAYREHALLETLSDNFNDNSIDTSIWDATGHSNGSVTEQNSRMEMVLNTGAAAGNFDYAKLATKSALYFKMTGSFLRWKNITLPNNAEKTAYGYVTIGVNRAVLWSYNNGTIQAIYSNPTNNSLYSATYSAGSHAYLRIRESGGTIYFDSSGDGATWTNRATQVPAGTLFLDAVYAGFEIDPVGTTTSTGNYFIDDVNIGKITATITHTTDSNKRVSGNAHTHTTDANKKVSGTVKTHTTDANKKKSGNTRTHTTDSFLRKQFTKTHTTDANRKVSGNAHVHTTDANKKVVGLTRSHTTDANKKIAAITRSHTTDANKKKTNTLTHTTDANKKKTNTLTHTTSANKKVSGITRTHTTDSFLRKQFTKTHTTDANKKKSGNTVSHTTNSVIRKQFTKTHTTDANLSLTATLGPNSPGTAADNGGGLDAWTNTGNILTSDNTYAQVTVGFNGSWSDYLNATNFGFHVPAGATINGIKVEIERSSANTIQDHSVKIIKGGTITGTEKADTGTNWPSSDAYATYGSASDLWGTTWTVNDINASTFGVALQAGELGGFNTAKVDHIRISVTYTPGIPFVSHTTSANLRKQITKTHTTDSNKKVAGNTRSHTTDAYRVTLLSSGPNSPTSGTNVTGFGTIAWSNPGNILASDNSYSDASAAGSGGNSNYLRGSGFGFSIPSSATIRGIKVEIENHASAATSFNFVQDARVRIVKADGSIGSTEKADTVTKWATSDGYITYGSSSDLWGETWAYTDINDTDFGAVIAANLTVDTAVSAFVDHMRITVYYTTTIPTFTKTHTTDSFLRKQVIKTHTTDANKKVSGTLKTHTTDANKKKSGVTITHTTDALKRKANTLTHTTSANKKKTTTLTHTTDSNKSKPNYTVTHTTDALKTTGSSTTTAYFYTLASGDDAQQVISTGAVSTTIQQPVISGLYHVGYRFPGITIPQGTTITSAHLQTENYASGTDNFTGGFDGVTVKGQAIDNAASFTTTTSDISARSVTTATGQDTGPLTNNIWGDLTAGHGLTVTTIVQEILNRGGWASGNAMAILFKGSGTETDKITVYHWDYFSGNQDTRLEIVYTTVSARAMNRVHSTDSMLRKQVTKTHTTDANRKKTTTVSHTTDANKKKIGIIKTHTTDSFLRKANTRSHTTDSLKRKGTTVSHSTDANKKLTTTRTHTTNSALRRTVHAKLTNRIEMAVGAYGTTGTANTYVEVPDVMTRLDTSAYDGDVKYYFEAALKQNGTTGQTAYVELYNHTDNVSVTGSELTNTANDGFPLLGRSGALSLAGDKIYTIRLKHSVSTNNAALYGARIIVVQDGDITKTQLHVELGSESGSSSTSNANIPAKFAPFLYEASKYDGTVAVRHDAVVKTTASNSVTSGIYDVTGSSVVSSSEVTKTNDTNYTLLSSGNITLTDGHIYKPTAYVSAGAAVTFESNKLVISITGGFSKFLTYMLVTAPGGFGPQNNGSNFYPQMQAWAGTNPAFDTADFAGGNVTTYYESNIAVNSSARTAYADFESYIHATSATSIPESLVSHTGDTLVARVRSGSFPMVPGYSEYIDGISSDSVASSASRNNSYVVFEVNQFNEITNVLTHSTDALKRKAVTLTHTTDAKLRKTNSLTHTTDANKKKTTTKTHTTDANLKKTTTRTHTTDANKKTAGLTRSHTTDALKRTANTRSHTTDSLKRKQFTKTHTTDAYVRSGFTRTHSTDANLKKSGLTRTHTTDANKRKTGLTVTHTTDSLKRKAFTLSHTTDALKRTTSTKTHTTDSFLRKANTRSHTTDANKKRAYTISHTTDANKKKTGNVVTHTTDALKRKQFTLTHTTDALKRKQFTKTHSTDSFLRKQFTKTHTTDANKRKATLVSHTTDANKKKTTSVFHTTDANKKKAALTRTHTTDSFLRQQHTLSHTTSANKRKAGNTVSHTADAFSRSGFQRFHNTDANKRKSGNVLTHTTDANKKVTGLTRSHTTDALKRKTNVVSHATDANKRRATTVFHTTDANRKRPTTVQHTTDANKRKTGLTLSHTTSSFIRKAWTLFHSTDANKKKSGNVVSHSTDANKKKTGFTLSHTTNSLLRKAFALTHTTDANRKKSGNTVQHSTDANKKKSGLTRTHTTDANKRKSGLTVFHTTSSNLKKTTTKFHTTDANKKKSGNTVSHTTDANKRIAAIVKTHTTDALKRKANVLSHTTNSVVRKASQLTHTTSSNKRKSGNTVSHTTNSFIHGANQVVHTTDANRKKLNNVVSHTTDASKFIGHTVSHTTSAFLRLAHTITHSTSANKRRAGTVSHLTDALKRKAGVVSHTTSSALRKVFSVFHTTSSNKKRAGTVSHSTDANKKKSGFVVSHTTDAFKKHAYSVSHTTSSNLKKSHTVTHTTDANVKRGHTVAHTTDALLSGSTTIHHSTDAFLFARRGNKEVLINGVWVYGTVYVLISGVWTVCELYVFNGTSWDLSEQ